MPSDLTGLSPADRIRLPSAPGSAAAGATSASSALTRIEPVDPRLPAATPTHPLGRSGLDLLDLLATTDLVAARDRTGTVALDVGLELARGALLRNLPGDALAALDTVWDGASHTEEGWYLRSGSLSVLGLPGESEQVAEAGVARRPESVALRFLQSVARLALGDATGARTVLDAALQRAPHEPLLLVQQALIHAKQGDTRSADALFARMGASTEHPAITWGRATLRTIVADATRQRSRPTPADWPAAIRPVATASLRPTPHAVDIFPDITGAIDAAMVEQDIGSHRVGERTSATVVSERSSTDVATSALERFGTRLAVRTLDEVAREARMLMRAFSAGGTLAAATNAEQAHAARTVLATFLGVATGEGAETPMPVRVMIQQLVPLLQAKRTDDAERLVRRHSMLAREPIGRLLLAIVRGAHTAAEADMAPTAERAFDQAEPLPRLTPSSAMIAEHVLGTPALGTMVVRGDIERSPVVPVRLGLALLEVPGELLATRNAESDGAGWGAARAMPASASDGVWSDGASVRAAALVCVALAAGALVTSHGAIAIGLAVGAVWLGLRRSGREGDGPRTHDETPPQ